MLYDGLLYDLVTPATDAMGQLLVVLVALLVAKQAIALQTPTPLQLFRANSLKHTTGFRLSLSSSSGGGSISSRGSGSGSSISSDGEGGGGGSGVQEYNALYDEEKTRSRKLSYAGFASRLSDLVTKSKLWGLYSMSLSLKPVYTKALSSLIGFVIGDILAQFLFIKRGYFSVASVVRMGAFGAIVHAPFGHFFYGFLERNFPGVNFSAVATKLAIDQILWAPVFGTLLFSFVGITAGSSPNLIFRSIKNNLLKFVLTSWSIWPIAHVLNFKYVTPKHRLLYINAVQILFNICLSCLTSRI